MQGQYQVVAFKTLGDERGSLIAIENGYNTPFEIKRVYYIFDTQPGVQRGFHAHIALKQIAIAVKGRCTFVMDDGVTRTEVTLDNPNQGLMIEGLIWREMKDVSPDCVLLVLASEHYNESDYIRNYDDFLDKARTIN